MWIKFPDVELTKLQVQTKENKQISKVRFYNAAQKWLFFVFLH